MNVQGDEPLVEPEAIDTLVEAIESEEGVAVSTLMVPIAKPADIMDPNIVKVVLDFDGNALYFSRAPIPWVRDREAPVHVQHMKHLGLYAFRREALLDFPTLPVGDLERVEQLEQLRWMENGYKIRVAETVHDSVSVDVPERRRARREVAPRIEVRLTAESVFFSRRVVAGAFFLLHVGRYQAR